MTDYYGRVLGLSVVEHEQGPRFPRQQSRP